MNGRYPLDRRRLVAELARRGAVLKSCPGSDELSISHPAFGRVRIKSTRKDAARCLVNALRRMDRWCGPGTSEQVGSAGGAT